MKTSDERSDGMAFDPATGTAADVRGLALWFDEGDDGAIRVRLRGVDLPLWEGLSTTTGDGRPWDADEARAGLVTLWGEDRGPVEYHAVVWRIVATLLGMLSREGRWRWALARAVIDEAAGLEPALGDAVGDNLAVQRLVDAVGASLERFGAEVREALLGARYGSLRAELGNVETDTGLWMAGGDWRAVEADLEAGGVLWLDEAGAAWLEREACGVRGRKAADAARSGAKERANDWRRQLTLGGWERDAAALWRLWFDPDRWPVPVKFARDLALALWLDEVGPAWARGRRHLRALPVPGLQGVLDLAGSRRVGERAYRPARIGAPVMEVGLDDGTPAATAEAVRAALGRDTLEIGVYGYLVFYHIVMRLNERMKAGHVPWDTVPKLEIATGKRLAVDVGAGDGGRVAHEVEAVLHLLSAVEMRDGRGNVTRLWHAPERRAHGGGRSAAWIVTPGELLRPTFTATQPKRSEWRRLVYLPDEMPDRSIVDRSQGAHVARLGLALPMLWKDAAGREDGARWLARPGVKLDDAAWAEIGGGLDRRRVLDGLEDTGWLETSGETVAPGAKLPQLRATLAAWASRRAKGKE
jgi:hypothetical protein